MRIRAFIPALGLALGLGAMAGGGLGCDAVEKTASGTGELVTGDVKKFYSRSYDDVVSAVKEAAKDLEATQVSEDDGLTKEARKRFVLTTKTKEDKKLIFIVLREDDTRTSVTIDTAAFSGSTFRDKVVATIEGKLGK
jgi:hypothetical protein